jgi:prephenate dehydratase
MMQKSVSIQGEPGAFHHLACERYFGTGAQVIYRETFKQVFDDLAGGVCDYIVAAIENTEFGTIEEVEKLMAEHGYTPIDQINVHVNFCLLCPADTPLGEIKAVYSQSPALIACSDFIENKLPGVKVNEYYDTAGAAKFVSQQQDPSLAAIASKKAGEIYGLKVLAEDIENHRANITRFVVLRADSKRS